MASWQPVPRVSLATGSPGEVAGYLAQGVPMLVDGFFDDTLPAFRLWNRDYFGRGKLGRTRVHAQRYNESSTALHETYLTMTLAGLLRRMDAGEQLQVFAVSHPWTDFVVTTPVLVDAYRDHIARLSRRLLPDAPPFLGLDAFNSSMWPWGPPYTPNIFVSSRGVRTQGHYDPDTSHTLNWCIWGLRSVRMIEFSAPHESRLWKLKYDDMYQRVHVPFGLRGWATKLRPGEVLLMPSKTWHWFKADLPSASFGLRARSFGGTNALEGYCKYAHGYQGPSSMVRGHAGFWRRMFNHTPPWPPIAGWDAAGRALQAEQCFPGASTSVDIGSTLAHNFAESTKCTDDVVEIVCPRAEWVGSGGAVRGRARYGDRTAAGPRARARAADIATRCKGFVPDAFLKLLELVGSPRSGPT